MVSAIAEPCPPDASPREYGMEVATAVTRTVHSILSSYSTVQYSSTIHVWMLVLGFMGA